MRTSTAHEKKVDGLGTSEPKPQTPEGLFYPQGTRATILLGVFEGLGSGNMRRPGDTNLAMIVRISLHRAIHVFIAYCQARWPRLYTYKVLLDSRVRSVRRGRCAPPLQRLTCPSVELVCCCCLLEWLVMVRVI